MAISAAVPRDGLIYVFDAKGKVTVRIPLGRDKTDGLVGFTPSTVTIRRGGLILVYGEDGAIVSRVATGPA